MQRSRHSSFVALLALIPLLGACRGLRPPVPELPLDPATLVGLPSAVAAELQAHAEGEVFLAFWTPAERYAYSYRGDELVHAASTMKVAVMLGLYAAAERGDLSLDDTLVLRNEFIGIMDGARYQLSADVDGDPSLYELVGTEVTYRELCRRMIVRSSNLATNVLVEVLGAGRIHELVTGLGVTHMRVLRGVEDDAAYRAGWSNFATANDLARLLRAIVREEVAGAEDMLAVLEGQEFGELIPAALPPGVTVANKTGSITGILHDAAIVKPPPGSGAPYVLVILTRRFPNAEAATAAIHALTRAVHASRPMELRR